MRIDDWETEPVLTGVIHVSIEALDSLGGILRVDSIAYIHQQYETMYCGVPVMPGPTEWISPRSIRLWKEGHLTVLPNCPSCSVAWDEALECYYARMQAST